MKMKKAMKVGRKYLWDWIAVDKNGNIFAYTDCPTLGRFDEWLSSWGDFTKIGVYTGKKHWTTTRRGL